MVAAMSFTDWWVPVEPLPDSEPERLSALANLTVSTWRAVGGRLIATDARLVFWPNRVDAALGGRAWQVRFADVREVGRRAPTWNPLDGGLRSRLRIVTRDGAEHLFVVNGLARVIEQIGALARAAGGLR